MYVSALLYVSIDVLRSCTTGACGENGKFLLLRTDAADNRFVFTHKRGAFYKLFM